MTRIYLAPLKGFTDYIFRNVYSEHFEGVDLAVAPFIATTKDFKISKSRVRDILPENNKKIKVIPQILSNNPSDFINLADYMHTIGYDEVNLNLGCPHKTVTKKRKGSYLLSDPQLLDQMLNDFFEKSECRLSLKVRNGFISEDEIFDLVPVFNRYPLSTIIIHPRTGDQEYKGSVSYKTFEEVAKLLKSEIVYNGDIFNYKIYEDLKKNLKGIDNWMLGRGIMYNPFLPSEIKGRSEKGPVLKKIRDFHDDLCETYRENMKGPAHFLDRMKGVWFFLSQSFEEGRGLLKKIRKTKSVAKYHSVIDCFFDSIPVWNPAGYETNRKKN